MAKKAYQGPLRNTCARWLDGVQKMIVIGGMMKDEESQSKGGPVTKTTKLGKSLNKGATVRSSETLEMGSASINFSDVGGSDTLTAPCFKRGSPKLDIAEQIGLGLRSVYDDVLAQPVPDRFFELLRQLETFPGAQAKKDAT